MNSAEVLEATHLRHVPPMGTFAHLPGANASAILGEFFHKGGGLEGVGEQQQQMAEDEDELMHECHYEGTDYLEVKILLIGVFASGLALCSFLLNAFLVLVFAQNPKLRRSPLFYFGVLALLDLALALLYLALMSVPVYMDQFRWLWLYHLFLHYLRPMMTLSNFAMFASVLMILLATTERLLLTFPGKNINRARRLLERHRPQVTAGVMSVALAYKFCTFYEIEVAENVNCTGFEQFEVVSAVHEKSTNPMFTIAGWDNYKFWWMFVCRNLVDHIVPFFLLVILNFHIVRALRRERLRATQQLVDSLYSGTTAPAFVPTMPRRSSEKCGGRRGSLGKSLRESLRNKVRLRQKVSGGTAEDQAQKKNLRAATRALVSVVSMYLMSKCLQVAVTFFETFASDDLIMEANFGEFRPVYSYVNDAISILTLMSSALRFPVYCACNKPMLIASKATLSRLLGRKKGPEDPPPANGKRKSSSGSNSLYRNGPALLHRNEFGGLLLANGRSKAASGPNGRLLEDVEEKSPPGKRRVLRLVQQQLKQNGGRSTGECGAVGNGLLETDSSGGKAGRARMASPEEEEDELFC